MELTCTRVAQVIKTSYKITSEEKLLYTGFHNPFKSVEPISITTEKLNTYKNYLCLYFYSSQFLSSVKKKKKKTRPLLLTIKEYFPEIHDQMQQGAAMLLFKIFKI